MSINTLIGDFSKAVSRSWNFYIEVY